LIAYFDTSGVVPLLVEEAGSDAARRLWDQAERVVTIRLLYAEARAALAQAQRMGRMGAAELRAAVGLRGYDAVHLAAAQQAADDDLVVVGGDLTLLHAAQALGLRIAVTR